jgi:hypothetical protein
MRLVQRFAVLASLAPLLAVTARAQTSTPYSIQGSLIYVVPGGDAFADTDPGAGIELQVRKNVSLMSYGVGIQYSSHNVGLPDKLSLTGVFFEPRRVFPGKSSKTAPYASARLAMFQQKVSAGGVSGSATGGQLNVGGGLLIRASKRMNVDLGATVGYLRFGGFKLTFQNSSFVGKSSSGYNFVLRAGLAFGLGAS